MSSPLSPECVCVCVCLCCVCRCQREWRYACHLAGSEEEASGGRSGPGQVAVVVAAFGKCSRPETLKGFLYLDFIDTDKREAVLKKLVDTIRTYTSCAPSTITMATLPQGLAVFLEQQTLRLKRAPTDTTRLLLLFQEHHPAAILTITRGAYSQ